LVKVNPGLEVAPVELCNQRLKVAGSAFDTVDEEHGDFSGFVRLEEVDSRTIVENEVERRPQALRFTASIELGIREVGDLSDRRSEPEARNGLIVV
jgi:hypothetical protein